MSVEQTVKSYEFKAEVKQLLDILVHSLYTSREIFLRELISNASDALDKIRFETIKGTEVVDKNLPFEITIDFDEKKQLITVTDTGIGMTRDELILNIGTIAKSGSAEFIKKVAESKSDAVNIIGKFGVGFYSVFMAAKEVVIKTKSYLKDEPAVEWKSDGQGGYEISELSEPIKRGTKIEIHLKEDAKEFADKFNLERIIKKHSNFISFPIYINTERINTIVAIWREPKSSLKKEQYDEFYKFLTYESDEPLSVIHNSVDAPIQFHSLLFIPKKNIDFFGFGREDYGLDLYVRKVLIQHKNKDLLPEYLGFVKGVVDSEDLPLNISRETLQENIIFTKIAQSVTTNILSHLLTMAKEESAKYYQFWKEHGKIFKLGYTDFANSEKFMRLLRFNSSFSKNADELISLEDYISRLKDGQKEIYFALGPSREAIELDPHLEVLADKDLEVLYLYDPLDEFVLTSLRKFKDYEFKSVGSVDSKALEKFIDVKKFSEEIEPLSPDDEKHFDSLLIRIKNILSDRVEDVSESKRLRNNPSCLTSKDEGISSTIMKMMRLANKEVPMQKKIFEVNKNHKLIRNLLKIFKMDSKDTFIENVINQLYDSALLLEGNLDDPYKLVSRLNKMLEQSGEWYAELKKL
jgi:molecular chaperone HtpG